MKILSLSNHIFDKAQFKSIKKKYECFNFREIAKLLSILIKLIDRFFSS
jgi:hypothetical protein